MPNHDYVHGYSPREHTRLLDQANTLAELLHHDTRYPPGAHILEAGCGVGAQTVILTAHSPRAQITSIDISPASVAAARQAVAAALALPGLGDRLVRYLELFRPAGGRGLERRPTRLRHAVSARRYGPDLGDAGASRFGRLDGGMRAGWRRDAVGRAI